MSFIVDVHQLTDGSVGVFLRGGKRLVAEEFLNGAQVSAIGEKMRGKGVAQGMRMQIPIHVDEADIFLDDAADGALREPAADVIEENGFSVRGIAMATAAARGLQEQLLPKGPIFVEGFLGLASVGDNAFLVPFADDAQHTLFLVDVGEIEAGKFTDAQACGVEQFQQGAVAAEQKALVFKSGKLAGRSSCVGSRAFLRCFLAAAGSWTQSCELI